MRRSHDKRADLTKICLPLDSWVDLCVHDRVNGRDDRWCFQIMLYIIQRIILPFVRGQGSDGARRGGEIRQCDHFHLEIRHSGALVRLTKQDKTRNSKQNEKWATVASESTIMHAKEQTLQANLDGVPVFLRVGSEHKMKFAKEPRQTMRLNPSVRWADSSSL